MEANIKIFSIFFFLIQLIGLGKTFPKNISAQGLKEGSGNKITNIYPISIFEKNYKSCVCGVSVKPRIIGGQLASEGEFPWQVALYYLMGHLCGGTLITNLHVVTAAHCLEKKLKHLNKMTVYLGVTDFYKLGAGYQSRNVVKAKMHPKYSSKTNHHDIAILKLSYAVQFTQKILPPCLGQTRRNDIGDMATVIGWGCLKNGGGYPKDLWKVEVPIRDPVICRKLKPKYALKSHQICAFWNEGGKDSCQGDSGSSMLIQNSETSRWFFVGIVSTGGKCAQPMTPAFYTRVSSYYDWITQETSDGVGCSG